MHVHTPHTILLVEDSEDDVFVFKRALKKTGGEPAVELATDGQKAIDTLSTSSDPSNLATHTLPSVVFLDLKLPYKNGLEVLEWIRAQPNLKDMPVVMLTGSEEPLDKQRAFALGARSYFVKPVTSSDIRRVLDSLPGYVSNAV